MGTEYYLVDQVSKRVLDVSKAWRLAACAADTMNGTLHRIEIARLPNYRGSWVRDRIMAWMDAGDVPIDVVQLRSEHENEFWMDYTDLPKLWHTGIARDPWRLYTVFDYERDPEEWDDWEKLQGRPTWTPFRPFDED